jgi:hypothetical protein
LKAAVVQHQHRVQAEALGELPFRAGLLGTRDLGEKKELIRDVALSGLTLESLKNVTGIGRKMNYSPGTCGKGGQMTPNTTGGAYMRISDVVVGGM